MGQKATPVSVRLQLNKNWTSKWFSDKNFADTFAEDVMLKKVIEKKLGRNAGVARIEILRSAQEIKMIVETSKPGIVIGRDGQGITEIKKLLAKALNAHREKTNYIKSIKIKNFAPKKVAQDKIDIEVMEIREPELYAKLVALSVAAQIEKRVSFRRAIKQAVTRATKNPKVLGIKITVAGRLDGAEIARREKIISGTIPLARFKSNIDYAQENAYTTYGVIGIKTWIYKKEENRTPNRYNK